MNKPTKAAKRRAWRRFLLYLLLLIFGLIFGGFLAFVYAVERQEQPSPVPKADGIVVWTGKGGGRLMAGAELLKQGYGERLLISGVNENNLRDDILVLLDLPDNLANCCVDLDYAARDTIGNARETSNWSEALGYEHIILVTSSYHMPRAEIEISAARGRIHITPYPVIGETGVKWWKSGQKMRRLSQEYGKLLLAYMRRTGDSTYRGTPRLEGLPKEKAAPAQNDGAL